MQGERVWVAIVVGEVHGNEVAPAFNLEPSADFGLVSVQLGCASATAAAFAWVEVT